MHQYPIQWVLMTMDNWNSLWTGIIQIIQCNSSCLACKEYSFMRSFARAWPLKIQRMYCRIVRVYNIKDAFSWVGLNFLDATLRYSKRAQRQKDRETDTQVINNITFYAIARHNKNCNRFFLLWSISAGNVAKAPFCRITTCHKAYQSKEFTELQYFTILSGIMIAI